MPTISVFTSMTNPDDRNDPWKEALKCYEELADEVLGYLKVNNII